MEDVCQHHSGCLADINNLKDENKSQWGAIDKMSDKVNSIMTRINIILGSVVVACIMLALNLLMEYLKK
jgi:hypothetical protein